MSNTQNISTTSTLNNLTAVVFSALLVTSLKEATKDKNVNVPEAAKTAIFIVKDYGFEAVADPKIRESLEFLDSQRIVHFSWNYSNLFCLQPDGRFFATQTGVRNPDGTPYYGVEQYYNHSAEAEGWDFYEPWPNEEDDRPGWMIAAELAHKISAIISVAGSDIFTPAKMKKALFLFKKERGQYGHHLSDESYNAWF